MATRKKRKKSGKKKSGKKKGSQNKKKASKKKRKGGPRGGKPAKAFLVARDNKGRLAGFKKITVGQYNSMT